MLLTYEEAAERLGVELRHVRRLVRAKVLPAEWTGRRHANGKRAMGIPEAAVAAYEAGQELPHDLQEAAEKNLITTRKAEPAPDALRRLIGLPAHIPVTPGGRPDLAGMRIMGLERQAAEYERRAEIVGGLKARLDAAPHGRHCAIIARAAIESGVSARTLRRWLGAVGRWGWAALVPAYGHGRGEVRALPPALQRQILDAYCYQGQMDAAQIYEHVVLPYFQGCKGVPHASTVQRFLRDHVPPLLRTITREGARAYQERHEPRIERDLESAGVNGWWCSDHRLADTMVLVADGQGAGWGKWATRPCPCGSGRQRRECCSVRRPWWTVTVDVCSAAFVGWRISFQPTASTVCHHLREAILRFGLPEHWMRDWGKEFTANRLENPRAADLCGKARWPAAMPPREERPGVWSALGVTVHNTIPYSSWSKYIESLFGAFSRRCENLLGPGYTGRSTAAKPEKLDREIERGSLLTIEQYVEVLGKIIDDWNETHPVGERPKPPLAYYAAGYEPRTVDAGELTFLLQNRARKKVHQGSLRLDGRRYLSEELALLGGMSVDVAWDPGAPAYAFVYPGDGRCIAVPEVPKADYGGDWGEVQRSVKRAAKAQREAVREWAAAFRGACPVEALDPYGGYRAVAARMEAVEAAGSAAGPGEEASRPALVAEQQKAIESAEAAPAQKEDPMRTVYADDLREIA